MNRFYATGLLIVLLIKTATAQTAKLHVMVTNNDFTGTISTYDASAKYDPAKKGKTEIYLEDHSGSGVIDVPDPRSFNLNFFFTADRAPFCYRLFLTPGDDLAIKITFDKKDNHIVVTGKGSNNNQPGIAELTNVGTEPFYADSLPYRSIAEIKRQQPIIKRELENYIIKNKPSDEFIKASRANVAYYAAAAYFLFKTNNPAFKRKMPAWQAIQDSLFATIKLSNDAALPAYNYTQLVNFFVMREEMRASQEEDKNPEFFYKEWYHTDVANGKK